MSIRWEARSHSRIYTEAHTSAAGPGIPLAMSVPRWKEIVADLGEVRTRYVVLMGRLVEAGAGDNVDAAAAAARLVTRGLTEAQERAGLARDRRARLSELNDRLRVDLPEPWESPERRTGFVDDGLDWLAAPDFHREEAARRNNEEIARDLMRRYEADIAPDRLTEDGPQYLSAVAGHTEEEVTIPLSAVRPQPGPAEPPSVAGWTWSDGDFGPRGPDDGTDDPDDDPDDDGARAAAGGAAPPWEYVPEPVARSRVSQNPFEFDIAVPPPVLGE